MRYSDGFAPGSIWIDVILFSFWTVGFIIPAALGVLLWRRRQRVIAIGALLWAVAFVQAAYIFLGPVEIEVPPGAEIDPGIVQCFAGEPSYLVAFAQREPRDPRFELTDPKCRNSARADIAVAAGIAIVDVVIIVLLFRKHQKKPLEIVRKSLS